MIAVRCWEQCLGVWLEWRAEVWEEEWSAVTSGPSAEMMRWESELRDRRRAGRTVLGTW